MKSFIFGKVLVRVTEVFLGFPGVIVIAVTFPFDKVPSAVSVSFMTNDGLDFPLIFSVDKVRWGLNVVRPVDGVFVIGR